MTDSTYNFIQPEQGVPIKAWTKGVPLEDAARNQLLNVAQLPNAVMGAQKDLVEIVHTLRQVVCVKG